MRQTSKAFCFLLLILCVLILSLSTAASPTQAAVSTQRGHIDNLAPDTAGTVTEYPIPTPDSQPVGITVDSHGNFWFTESHGNKIGEITQSGQITEYTVPTPNSEPEGITSGPDGNLWFTEFSGNKIGEITTNGQITEYSIPTANSEPENIIDGPDGNLWFTEFNGNNIGKITTSGQITEYAVPTANSEPDGITSGPDGNLWFTEFMAQNIGQITTSGQITEFPLPATSTFINANTITSGPDGKLWFTLLIAPAGETENLSTAKIGQIDPVSHQITESNPLKNPDSLPNAITTGPDGNLWFTEYYQIGSMTPGGNFKDYQLPSGSSGNIPDQIISNPQGQNLWFTEFGGNNIGEITTS